MLFSSVNLVKTTKPTYTLGNSYLDIGFIDNRIHIKNINSYNEVTTLYFESDHRAVVMDIKINLNSQNLNIFNENFKDSNKINIVKWHALQNSILNKYDSYLLTSNKDFIVYHLT